MPPDQLAGLLCLRQRHTELPLERARASSPDDIRVDLESVIHVASAQELEDLAKKVKALQERADNPPAPRDDCMDETHGRGAVSPESGDAGKVQEL